MNSKIKTIFMGTPDFAVLSFRSLINDNRFDIVACFTQPDRAVGRSGKLQKTPVKLLAEENSIPVYQPGKISNYTSYSDKDSFPFLGIDLIVVVAYAQIIPQKILDIPKYGCINVHGSLLPKYRGSSCIQASILNGDGVSGVTIMKMDKGMDTGDIINQAEIILDKKETTETLFEKISKLGEEILSDTIYQYISGNINPKKQNDMLSSIVKKTSKEDGKIDWLKEASYIEKQIRAMSTWPGAWTKIDGKLLKIIEADLLEKDISDKKIGQLFTFEKKLLIKCGQNTLEVLRLQLEGKKPHSATDFINGNKELLEKVLS
ncbi:MAG: methionyl-tRNA formyltransferase [Patescibacteria group bacterium]|nr:methionyl-tRNA formyltransferase [Patescibacteria group bacterium]